MWQLIGSAVAGLMILLTMPVYNDIQANNLAATVDADAASQFQTILAGAQKYAAAQKDTLTDTLSIGGAYQEVPFADLVNTDTVPGGFSQTNVLGATWHVYVQQPASGAIRTMVTATGGRTLTQSDLINIAGLTGDQGGYVPYDGMLGNLTSSEAHGTTWNLSLSGLPSPGAGHLFGTVTVGDAASPTIDTNDFLYRVGVPGHDELNTMGVALNMGSNNINNVGTINAEQGVFSGNVFAQSGNIIDLAATNIVSGGTVQTNRLSSASSDIVYLAARNVRIDENAQIYGTLNVNGRASMDAAITGTDGGNAIAGNACSDNGAIASSPDGTGTHLECVRGIWETLGGETSTTVSGSAGVYGSWTMIKTKDPTVPTGYRKRIMGESPWYSSSWGDHSFTIAFPEPFTAILPGAYGCALVSEGGGGHDNSPWLMSTPSLTQITVFVNWPTDGNGSDAMVTWWVEGY